MIEYKVQWVYEQEPETMIEEDLLPGRSANAAAEDFVLRLIETGAAADQRLFPVIVTHPNGTRQGVMVNTEVTISASSYPWRAYRSTETSVSDLAINGGPR